MEESMVKVHHQTTDQIVAWRVRDALAAHPLLGGATAQIHIIAGYEEVILIGWAVDEAVIQLALRLTRRVAGKRSVQGDLQICRHAANTALTKRIFDDNNAQALN
jgi:osmotically-inducible protein OsmY